jgi:hypothetical protein
MSECKKPQQRVTEPILKSYVHVDNSFCHDVNRSILFALLSTEVMALYQYHRMYSSYHYHALVRTLVPTAKPTHEERFPPLAELVQEKITRIDRPDAPRLLLKGIAAAPDEASARLLLELLVA